MTTRPLTLGTPQIVSLGTCELQAFEAGPADGPVIVFVQGLLVNADVWRDVVPALVAGGARCITVDWPLGAHAIPTPGADLTPPGVAALIGEVLEVLDLDDVTIVANDTGGALTQILMASGPERVGRVVLTPSDSFEMFFPPMFKPLVWMAHVPGAVWAVEQGMRARFAQRRPMAFGWLSLTPLPDDLLDSFVLPARRSRAVRKDLARFLRTVHKRHTLEAASRLDAFDKPVLLAWGAEDKFFPLSLAERLAAILPDARIELVPGARTLVPFDRPDILNPMILDFLGLGANGLDART
ncbi:MAG TPA: alpha/beta fold hydrolase [Marmoricola sp.]|nr:alpha/beta fold hydrolase [Marmoricola sp.]